MLLMICCVLFMPPHGHAGESKETQSFRMASLTLAVSGISNPVSQLKTFAESDGTSPALAGQTSAERLHRLRRRRRSGSPCPPRLPLPDFFLCAQEHFRRARLSAGKSRAHPLVLPRSPLPLRTSSYGRSSPFRPLRTGIASALTFRAFPFSPAAPARSATIRVSCADCLLTRASQRDHGPRTLQEDFSCVPCVGAPASRC